MRSSDDSPEPPPDRPETDSRPAEANDGLDRSGPERPGEELDRSALHCFLAETLGPAEEAGEELRIEQYPRGYSNLTYRVAWGGRDLVLRRPPFGAASGPAHDMLREHRILDALRDVFPKAPRPVAACADPAVLGAPFYLMERVRGVVPRPPWPEGRSPAPAALESAATALVETLVELHRVDLRTAGLGELGRPEGYVRRQIDGWSERSRRSRDEAAEDEIEPVAAWLADHVPRVAGAALIHNDYKHDNVVLAPGDWGRIVAVLDWEMATVGDPWMDLGTTLAYWVEPEDHPVLRELTASPSALPGSPSRGEVVEAYALGSDGEERDPLFYFVFGLFKVAVILRQIHARYRAGHTADRRFAGLDAGVRACGLTARQAIAHRRIDRLFP